MPTYQLAIIGGGNMAEAVVRGVLAGGFLGAGDMIVADPADQRRELFASLGLTTTTDNRQAAGSARRVLLAVKPQTLDEVLAELAEAIDHETLVISIAAGVSTTRIEAALGGAGCPMDGADRLETCPTSDRLETCPTSDRLETCPTSDRLETCPTSDSLETCPTSDRLETCPTSDSLETCPTSDSLETCPTSDRLETCPTRDRLETCPTSDRLETCPTIRVVRVMPNTPMLVGAGMSGVARGRHATDKDLAWARRLFECAGRVVVLADERLIDAVTAVSGSGPAYFFYLVEQMVAAGVAEGLSEPDALALATQTCIGAGKLLVESGATPAELRRRVTSPGGTTQAACETLDLRGAAGAIRAAVAAAARRSRELSGG